MTNTITTKEYDSLFKKEINDFSISPVHKTAIKTLEINQNDSVLDVGCGLGEFIFLVTKLNPKKATGTDFSEEAIKIAKLNVPNAEFLVEDITKTSLPNATFTKISGLGIVAYLSREDLSLCFSEIGRILKEGGLFLIRVPQPLNIVTFVILKIKTLGNYQSKSHRYPYNLYRNIAEDAGFKIRKKWFSVDIKESESFFKKIILFILFPFFAQRWVLFEKK